MSRVPAGTFMHQAIVETDIIGGFPIVDPNCLGCRQPLLVENAWLADGCSCNSPLGVNTMNETRWRLLMQLQQQQSQEASRLHSRIAELHAWTRSTGIPGDLAVQPAPNYVILELPLDPVRQA